MKLQFRLIFRSFECPSQMTRREKTHNNSERSTCKLRLFIQLSRTISTNFVKSDAYQRERDGNFARFFYRLLLRDLFIFFPYFRHSFVLFAMTVLSVDFPDDGLHFHWTGKYRKKYVRWFPPKCTAHGPIRFLFIPFCSFVGHTNDGDDHPLIGTYAVTFCGFSISIQNVVNYNTLNWWFSGRMR